MCKTENLEIFVCIKCMQRTLPVGCVLHIECVRNHRESDIYRILLSGRTPPAGVHGESGKSAVCQMVKVFEVI